MDGINQSINRNPMYHQHVLDDLHSIAGGVQSGFFVRVGGVIHCVACYDSTWRMNGWIWVGWFCMYKHSVRGNGSLLTYLPS